MARKQYRGKAARCCIPDCKRRAKRRGLCDACYTLAWRAVHEGRETWATLEAAGLARPLLSQGAPFRAAISAKRK